MDEPRRYGRRLFLATVAGGVSSLYWGKAAWDHVTGVVTPVASRKKKPSAFTQWRSRSARENRGT